MYLEQSLFGLHRALSRLLPNKLLIALMMLLLAVLLKEMVSWASQESLVDLNNCLQEYYDRTRTMMHNPSTNLTEKQAGIIVDNQTLLNIHFVSDQTHKCTIVLNSNFSVHNNSENGDENSSSPLDTSEPLFDRSYPDIHLATNPLLLFLDTDPSFRKTHNIIYNNIYISANMPIYIWPSIHHNPYLELVEEIITEIIEEFRIFQERQIELKNNESIKNLQVFYHETSFSGYSVGIAVGNYIDAVPRTVFAKIGLFCLELGSLLFVGLTMGMMIRCMTIALITLALFVFRRCSGNRGWINYYLNLLFNRPSTHCCSSLLIGFFFILGSIGSFLLLSFGCKYYLQQMIYSIRQQAESQAISIYIKNIFIIELTHYFFSRSRLALKYYSLLSYVLAITVLLVHVYRPYRSTFFLCNVHLLLQLLLVVLLLALEKRMILYAKSGLGGQYTLTYHKPRMLFYAGYDISWNQSIPPLWTYFSEWFDYSCFSDKEKCFIERDYQLLYGLLQGMNEPQQLPEESEEEQLKQDRSRIVLGESDNSD